MTTADLLARMRADLATLLEIPQDEIGDDDFLPDLGLDSMRLMDLVQRWQDEGWNVNFGVLAERPQLSHWHALRVADSGGRTSP